jgi:hypothetical protein
MKMAGGADRQRVLQLGQRTKLHRAAGIAFSAS